MIYKIASVLVVMAGSFLGQVFVRYGLAHNLDNVIVFGSVWLVMTGVISSLLFQEGLK